MIEKKSVSRALFKTANTLLFLFFILLCAYPIWFILIQSLSGAILPGKALIIPHEFTLSNYKQVFQLKGVSNAVLISEGRTVIGTCITVISCMLLGFLFSKKDMPGRKFLYRMLTVSMYVSGGMIPTFLVMKAYGLLNNFWVYVLPTAVNAYYVILIKTYIYFIS